MFVINEDNSIYVTRGDVVFFSVTAEDNGKLYTFQPGDVVRMKVYGRKDAESVVLQKDFAIFTATESADIYLSEADTKFGDVISKPTDYWYEIELNPYTEPQTIIGYDEDGAKVFKLFPEGDDIPEYVPEPEVIKVIDDELDMTSTRPVQNQAIARAITQLEAAIADTSSVMTARTTTLSGNVAELDGEIATERARVDNLIASAAAPVDADANYLEVADIRVGADGVIYGSAGTAVRKQFADMSKNLNAMTYCMEELYLKGHFEPELSFENKYFNSNTGKLVASEVRAITNPIYCPYGALVDIRCNEGYAVSSAGNYDAYGNYLGYGHDFTGMVFRRYVIAKTTLTDEITPEEARSNVVVYLTLPDVINRNKVDAILRNVACADIGKNLLNKKHSEPGYIMDEFGRVLDLGDDVYSTSEFIPVEAGASLTISPRARKFLAYDEHFRPITESYLINEVANYTYNATQKGFVRFTYYNVDKYVQVEHGDAVTNYEAYHQTLNEDVFVKQEQATSVLSGKVGVSFGDSIMYGSGNGGEGVLDILGEKYGIVAHDYSVGGASIQKHSGRSFIGDQITKAISDGIHPDFILIDGLSNDITISAIGEMTKSYDFEKSGYSTFADGLGYCFGLLKEAFPTVPILYVIPHSSAGRDYDKELAFGNMAREICNKWSIPIADIYKDGNMNSRLVKQMQEFSYYPAETSGTHPNRAGYLHAYIPVIKSALEKMVI